MTKGSKVDTSVKVMNHIKIFFFLENPAYGGLNIKLTQENSHNPLLFMCQETVQQNRMGDHCHQRFHLKKLFLVNLQPKQTQKPTAQQKRVTLEIDPINKHSTYQKILKKINGIENKRNKCKTPGSKHNSFQLKIHTQGEQKTGSLILWPVLSPLYKAKLCRATLYCKPQIILTLESRLPNAG